MMNILSNIPDHKHQQLKRPNFLPIISFLGLLLIGIIGCESSDDEPVDMTVASIQVLPEDEPLISLGQEVQLEVIASNSAGNEVPSGTATWTSSDPSILEVNSAGLMTGESVGTATIMANVGGMTNSIDFRTVDLTGTWIGGEDPDTVRYILIQTGTSVDGEFQSALGFPPITDVKTGILTGSLSFDWYPHTLAVTTETGCELEIKGGHRLQVEADGKIILVSGGPGFLSSDCSSNGTIDFATLRRE